MSSNTLDALSSSQTLLKQSAAKQQAWREGNFKGNGDTSAEVQFTKSLRHDPNTGIVLASDFKRYMQSLRALGDGSVPEARRFRGFSTSHSDMKLAAPTASLSFDLEGPLPSSVGLPAAPRIGSKHAAADLLEVYEQYMARDIAFDRYAVSRRIGRAASRLSSLTGYIGPRDRRTGKVERCTIFRGETGGDLVGPYISQLLLLPFDIISMPVEQKYLFPLPGTDFMRSWGNTVACQSGDVLETMDRMSKVPRYIRTGRDLAWYVGQDISFQPFMNAVLALKKARAPFSPHNPFCPRNRHGTGEGGPGFLFGYADVIDCLSRAASCAIRAAWFHKWIVNGRMRPEAMAMIVDRILQTDDNPFDIHQELLDSRTMLSVHRRSGNLLLPQVYPEGAPCHPSYPSGHAAIAGACSVIMKAFFDEDWVFPSVFVPDDEGACLVDATPEYHRLTLRGEVDKLASNIALGRNWAGIHYRSDAKGGWVLGERVALRLLQDLLVRYPLGCRFRFHTRDGTEVTID